MQVVAFDNWHLANARQAPSLRQPPPWGSSLLWVLSRTQAEPPLRHVNTAHGGVMEYHGGKVRENQTNPSLYRSRK